MNLPEFDAAIKSWIAGWNPLTLLVGDNRPSRTSNEHEYIRLTILQGVGFLDESAGVRTVDGSSVQHTFILQFDVFTRINSDTSRASDIIQDILDNWQVKRISDGCTTLAGTVERIGEEAPRYHMAVSIEGQREEFINT